MAKLWSHEEIRKHLAAGETVWLERAILAIGKQQTPDEWTEGVTVYSNRRGFNQDDAFYGTYLAMFLESGKSLTDLPPALEWAQREMPKYARQLARIANAAI